MRSKSWLISKIRSAVGTQLIIDDIAAHSERRLSQMQSAVTEHTDQLANLLAEMSTLRQSLEKRVADSRREVEEIASIEMERITQLKVDIEHASSSLTDVRTSLSNDVNEITDKISEVSRVADRIEVDNREMDARNRTDLQEVRSQLNAASAAIAELSASVQNQSTDILRVSEAEDLSAAYLQDLGIDLMYAFQDMARYLTHAAGISPDSGVVVETAHPLALDSDDHKFPRGAASDNTRYPRFCRKVESVFGRAIRLVDLGAAGGGLVWDLLLSGNFAVGLEGSDYSLVNQRAFWPVIPNYLFTCDISKPFQVLELPSQRLALFDVVSCWEVLEHIREEDLPELLSNIKMHLREEGLLLASVATFEDSDPDIGAKWHVTVREREWWEDLIKRQGFEMIEGMFEPLDFPRGSGNGRQDWSSVANPELGFHVVASPIAKRPG